MMKTTYPVGTEILSIMGECDCGPDDEPRETGANARGQIVRVDTYPNAQEGQRIGYWTVFLPSGVVVILHEGELADGSIYKVFN